MRDIKTEDPIVNVYLSDAKQQTVGVSNEEGIINFSANNSSFWVTSHVAYRPDTIFLKDLQASNLLLLTPAENSLTAVAIVAKRATYGSVATLSEREIKTVPTLLGEADPLRAALRIAGVESGGEVNSRLHVRGGLPGENLTLLDGVPIYNETHVGPLFSVFNADVLQQFSIHKIAAPAEKGSGISALLDAETKLPSFTKPEKKLNIGPINSSFYLNGPWRSSEKTALAIGLRGSPLSLLSLLRKPENIRNATLIELGDINAAIRHKLGSRSELIGRAFWTYDEANTATQDNFTNNPDIVDLRERNVVSWSNRGYSLTHNQSISQAWTSKIQLYGAQYSYQIADFSEGRDVSGQIIDSTSFSFQGRVNDVGLRVLLTHTYTSGQLKVGLNAKQQESLPVTFEERTESLAVLSSLRRGNRVDGFFNLEQSLNNKTKFTLSGKLNSYWTDGYEVYLPTGFVSLQRKIGAVAVKITGERIAQFEHALPAFGGGWQLNAWLLASEFAPAAAANRVEVSVNYSLGKYVNVTQAVYFRSAANLIRTATEDFTRLLTNDQIAAENCCATGGSAENYGLETSINYKSKNVELGINYTLARSENTFSRINAGRSFSPRFDRRHSFNFWLTKPFANDRWVLNTQFVYQSGIAYTAPIAQVPRVNGISRLFIFDQINNARFPPAHRLDVGLDRKWTGHKGNQNTISIGAYNLYNRANPINFSFRSSGVILPSTTRFPIPSFESQPSVEGAFGFLPYLSFRKTFTPANKP